MKQKILEALKQGYGKGSKLGLADDCEAFERVASLGETFITSEEQIANFVKGAESIFKDEQSKADKKRQELATLKKEYEGKVADLEARLNGGGEPSKPEPQPQPNPQDFAKMIADAVAGAIRPMQEELALFKGEQAAKKAFTDAETAWKSDGYVKKYAKEANNAWERAVEINEIMGNKMTADELVEKAKGYFKGYVADKGVDITKPFDSEGNGDDTPDFSHFERAAEELGLTVNN